METGVLIVGAGPVGMTAADLLGRYDTPYVLIASEAVLATDLRASTFHPPTLGLAAPLVAQGLRSPTWQVRLHETGERAEFDPSVLAGDTRHPFRLQCEQSRLCRLLLDRLTGGGDVELLLGWQLEAVVQDEAGVTLTARPVAGGDPVMCAARDVIGADGSRSAVRRAAGIGFEGRPIPRRRSSRPRPSRSRIICPACPNVNYVWKDGGTFSLLRLRHLWRCSLYPDHDETVEDGLRPASIARKLREIAPSDAPRAVLETRAYRVHMRIADTYRAGRVLLAGDAAHLNSPAGGMGMNGGVHDAFELAETLRQVWGGAAPALLDRYTRRRRPIAEQEMLVQADRNRARMHERDGARRLKLLAALQATASDREAAREHLLRSSMIAGLRRAAAIA